MLEESRKWKTYGREFLSQDTLFEALTVCQNERKENRQRSDFRNGLKAKNYLDNEDNAIKKQNIRIPLSAIVDYKGFRAIGNAQIRVIPKLNPKYGMSDFRTLQTDDNIKQELQMIGKVLNIKDNKYIQGN